VALKDNLKIAGAVAVEPSQLSLSSLKSSSALGAQYTAKDYTISGVTEGLGAGNKATYLSKIGDKDIAFAASMAGMGHNPVLSAAITTKMMEGVTGKAGLSTSGDVDVELRRKLIDRVTLRVGAKTNINSPTKPKFGAQLSIEDV